MLFVYVLSSALAAAAVLGRSQQPVHVEYDETELQATDDRTDVTAGVSTDGGDARAVDVRFVLAIQRSTMWTDIKRRTAKFSTNPWLAARLDALMDADPDSLSDDGLALVKRACHDGLKCVAVDQLLVLRSATEQLPNGLMAVRQVITKITHVISNYTTEYYEDTYQYEEVTESDDRSKVDETVTVIVEDNKELCGIGSGDDVAVAEDETVRTTVARDALAVVDGTVSLRSDGGGDDAAAAATAAATTAVTATPAAASAAGANAAAKPTGAGPPDGRGRKDDAAVRAPSAARDHGDLLERGAGAGGRARRGGGGGGDDDDDDDDDDADSDLGRSVTIASMGGDDGGRGTGDRETKADVASAGDRNAIAVKKGYVEDGVVNNGEMNLYNINVGSVNRSNVNKGGAGGCGCGCGASGAGGRGGGTVVNMGAIVNGPANYGTVASMDDAEMRQYTTAVDQMYSTIIDGLSRQ